MSVIVVKPTRAGALTVRPRVSRLVLSSKGQRGAPGQSGDAITVTRLADGAIGGHRVVRATSATRVGYADASDVTNSDDVLGLSTQSADDAAPLTVVTDGEVVESSWNWTPLETIYLTGMGLLSQTPPDAPDVAFVLVVGFATSATSMRVRIGVPVIL